jgi:hypothetical protein
MNLRWVHAILIMLSAAVAVLFGIWCLRLHAQQDGGVASLFAAGASFVVSLGLVAYDSWFLRKTRSLR